MELNIVELMGKQCNDSLIFPNEKLTPLTWFKNAISRESNYLSNQTDEISSFQSLCAVLWRDITRARKLLYSKTIMFRMAVNCRHRLVPRLETIFRQRDSEHSNICINQRRIG
ncbi:HXXXD-type acyl-transferase family protein [Forsythia ovata]|uniref:HXXXD-type acyl-transferase family protein n=1 Tax=Forsythia ovata TaxID=205694 RepID=A0ABD1WX21_9LAMI